MRSVVMITSGPSGSGKSYTRCARFLADEFLPDHEPIAEREDGSVVRKTHISNFPVGGDARRELLDFVASKHAIDRDELEERLEVVPESIRDQWHTGAAGPWDYFHGRDLSGCHIAIDEIHNFCGKKSSRHVKRQWQEWLGEIRHRGATVEFLSQSIHKVATELTNEAEIELELTNCEALRDPWLAIPMCDWWELQAAFITGEYRAVFAVTERRMSDRKKKVTERNFYPRDSKYFAFYDSYSAPEADRSATVIKPKHEFERRGRLSLLGWFLRRHWHRLGSRAAVLAGVVWLCFLGGGAWLMPRMLTYFAAPGKQLLPNGQEYDPPPAESRMELIHPATSRKVHATTRHVSATTAVSEAAERLRAQLAASREREAALRAEAERVRRRLDDAFSVVLLTHDSVTFRGGYSYAIGERIDHGPYTGRTVQSVTWKRRAVHLDDGTVLRMGAGVSDDVGLPVDAAMDATPLDAAAAPSPRTGSSLPRPVRPGDPRPAAAPADENTRTTAESVGSSDASGSLRPLAR